MTTDRSQRPLVEIRGLGVTYSLQRHRRATLGDLFSAKRSEFWALKDVNLEWHSGQLIGVVGDNGAGKTTLCLVISQILSPTRGAVIVRAPVTSLLAVGAGYDRELSGLENMRIYAALLRIPGKVFEERLKEAIEFSGLGDFVYQPFRTYSTGMRSRLSFAVATMVEPEILVLDEVLAGGDQGYRKKVRERIEGLMQRSRLVIMVSHSLDVVRELCTHALWLRKGRVERFGGAEEVVEAYERH